MAKPYSRCAREKSPIKQIPKMGLKTQPGEFGITPVKRAIIPTCNLQPFLICQVSIRKAPHQICESPSSSRNEACAEPGHPPDKFANRATDWTPSNEWRVGAREGKSANPNAHTRTPTAARQYLVPTDASPGHFANRPRWLAGSSPSAKRRPRSRSG